MLLDNEDQYLQNASFHLEQNDDTCFVISQVSVQIYAASSSF